MKRFLFILSILFTTRSFAEFTYSGSAVSINWDIASGVLPTKSITLNYIGGTNSLIPTISGVNQSQFKVSINRCSGTSSRTCSLTIALNRGSVGTYSAVLNLTNTNPSNIILSSTITDSSTPLVGGGNGVYSGIISPSQNQVIDFTQYPIQRSVINYSFKNTSGQSINPMVNLSIQNSYSFVNFDRCSNSVLKPNSSCSYSVTFIRPPLDNAFNQTINIKHQSQTVASSQVNVLIGTTTPNASCNNNEFWNGLACYPITYTASYSPYLPLQSTLAPCSGVVQATRTVVKCLRNDTFTYVSNSFCIDPSPSQPILSPGGNVNETIPHGSEINYCGYGSSVKNLVSRTCESGYIDNGSGCVQSGFIPTYSAYSPNPSLVSACQGSVVSNRSIISCQSIADGSIVSNSNCTDNSPSITTQSPAGNETISILNGSETRFCIAGSTIRTPVSRNCDSGYFDNGSSCQLISYIPTFSNYSPEPSTITACQGVVVSNRTITSCIRSDTGQVMPNGTCIDFSPSVSTQSPSGSIQVGISHGTEQRFCSAGSSSYVVQSRVCDAGWTDTGIGCGQEITYTPNFSSYSPDPSELTPCQGSLIATRTITHCYRSTDGQDVSSSFCVDPFPNSPINSPYGTIQVSIPNGTQSRTCQAGSSIYTIDSTSCEVNFHVENNTCVSNTKSCPILNGSGTQTWNGSSYSSCSVNSCDSGFFAFGNNCQSTTKTCYTQYGQGTQTFDGTNFGFCENISCDPGSYLLNGTCYPFQKVSSGSNETGLIASNQKLFIGGSNSTGVIGDNSTTTRSIPVATYSSGAILNKTFIDLSLGNSHTCALSSDSKVYCWGSGSGGVLGNNLLSQSLVPVQATTSGNFTTETIKSVVTANLGSCALSTTGNLYCWGANNYNGTNSIAIRVPTLVNSSSSSMGTSPIKEVVSMGLGFCALNNQFRVYCWGLNSNGGLGTNDFTTATSSTPVEINYADSSLSGKRIYRLFGGKRGVCALATDESLHCWGHTDISGNSSIYNRMAVLIPFNSNTYGTMLNKSLKHLSVGFYSMCATTIPMGITCWGENNPTYQNFGSASPRYNDYPVDIDLNSVISQYYLNYQSTFAVRDLSLGISHSCMIISSGEVLCWGDNTNSKAIFGFAGQTIRTTPDIISCYGGTFCY